MIFIYNIAFLFFGIFYLPFFLLRVKQAECGKELVRQRLGLFSSEFKEKLLGKKVIWIHAVSVGEVHAVEGFVKELLSSSSEYYVVLTTVTPTGQKMAKKLESERLTACYFPFDFTFAVKRFMKVLGPKCLLLTETEIWPNLLLEAKKERIYVGVLNARLSAKSVKKYHKVRFFFRRLFQSLEFVLVQTPRDAEHFLKLGVEHEKVHILGNMKFDNWSVPEAHAFSRISLRQEWGFNEEDLVLIAGSTHEGEEKMLAEAYLKAKSKFPQLKMVIAPRHIERSGKIKKMIEKKELRVCCTTDSYEVSDFDVLILNQLGILKRLYGIADLVFMGGSLIPHGGQNPIEPAYFKQPILHGQFVSNFEFVYRQLHHEGGAILIRDQDQLAFALTRLLAQDKERKTLGENAYHVVQGLRGATQKHVLWISEFLQEKVKKTKEGKVLPSQISL